MHFANNPSDYRIFLFVSMSVFNPITQSGPRRIIINAIMLWHPISHSPWWHTLYLPARPQLSPLPNVCGWWVVTVGGGANVWHFLFTNGKKCLQGPVLASETRVNQLIDQSELSLGACASFSLVVRALCNTCWGWGPCKLAGLKCLQKPSLQSNTGLCSLAQVRCRPLQGGPWPCVCRHCKL